MEEEIEKLKTRVNNLECAMRSALERIPHGIEEKKTLSDKITTRQEQHKMNDAEGELETSLCYTNDVKKALKEFVDWLIEPKRPAPKTFEIECEEVKQKAKEILGDRLT